MSHSQLPVLFLLTVQSFSIFDCKEYNQSDSGVDHLVMSMKESPLVLLEEGVCYDQCVLLRIFCQPLLCFIFVLQGQTCLLLQVFIGFLLLHSNPYDEKGIFFWCSLQTVMQVFIEPFYFNFFGISGWGHRLEWFALEMNSDHSVNFETVPKYYISYSFAVYEGYSLFSKEFLPTVVDIMVI